MVLAIFCLIMVQTLSWAASSQDAVAGQGPMVAQEKTTGQPDDGNDRSWGGQNALYVNIPQQAFVPLDSATTYEWASNNYVYPTASGTWFGAPLTLPAGASLHGVRFFYYDNSSSDIRFLIEKYTGVETPATAHLLDGYSSGTPGYTSKLFTLDPYETIFYGSSTPDVASYVIWVSLPNSSTMFRSARIFYKLEIPAAPSTATFTDVPTTSPYFQYVEAIRDAGIANGYGDGRYGPDDYVTRGQMAIFISRAVGMGRGY